MEAILKESHEDRWLEQGWYFLLQFREGWVPCRVTSREPANLRPFSLGPVAAGGNLALWNEIQDVNANRVLMPQNEQLMYHIFWGVTPPKARVYVQFPPRADVGSLLGQTRTITGDIGYIDGDISPFNGPLSPKTELFNVYERYPAVQVFNPLGTPMYQVLMQFDIMKYGFKVIKNKVLVKELLTGNRKVKKYTMGPTDPNPMSIPKWLSDMTGSALLEWTNATMEAEE